MGRDRYSKQSLGYLHGRIKKSRILMVGAGGIGCELLKNLVLTGFGEIHIVDLDTIDLSNLNRQFLFRHEHIKKSKAMVAKESAAQFNPHVKLEAYHANIKDPQFDIDFFQTFKLVFNALDNLDARRHVNKMCLAADVPLIESGTTGFNGQVQVIQKGKTECYDCNPKPVPKSFPVCTIRSTPSQPIHCIVWAKSYLFTEIFGTSEDETSELDHSDDSENGKEIENLRQEAQALKKIRESMGSDEFPRQVFVKVFKDDINRLRSMEDMWRTRTPPQALDYDQISKDAEKLDASVYQRDHDVWTQEENLFVFRNSLYRLSVRLQQAQSEAGPGTPAMLVFDKDDDETLDFVAATANLRSLVFGIERRSKFDIKQIAGNIIPAIATTNAMTAGLCVLQAFKLMRDDAAKGKMVFLERTGARVINTDTSRSPNPECSICGVMQSRLIVDPARATLIDLVEDVLKSRLGYGDEFSINSEAGMLYDPDLDDNLCKKFTDLGLTNGSFLTVIDDDEENPRVNLCLSISEQTLLKSSKPVMIPQQITIAYKSLALPPPTAIVEIPKNAPLTNGTTTTNGTAPSTNGATAASSSKRKRSLELSEEDEQTRKRVKDLKVSPSSTTPDDDVIFDESTDGAILIDDD